MLISVFYSWQSELPKNINRYLIRDALGDALRIIQRDYELDERPELDHDTKGTLGLPDIVQTIFSKIEVSSAFVADVSFTSRSSQERLCANANVLIELGFALHSLGYERLILVMNNAFGSPNNQMPFNLAARRWPISFTLEPDADKATRQKVCKELSTKIVEALKVMVDSGVLFTLPTTSSSLKSDRLLFAKLLEQFPASGEITYFLSEVDLATPILSKWLNAIDYFVEEWNNSLHEFIDPVLEAERASFMQLLIHFRQELSLNIWRNLDHPSLYSMELDELDSENPRWEKRDELNTMATAVYQAHQELIRLCKTKLGFPEAGS